MMLRRTVFILCYFVFGCYLTAAYSQAKVGLDNWFNHETNTKTGKPYHYLWDDLNLSGYSRWGGIFTDKGASISTLNRPNDAVLSKIDIYIIVDPDTTSENPNPNYMTPEDIKVIEAWVKKGGVLMILANDGRNCDLNHLNQLTSRFGIKFNSRTMHPVINPNWDMGAFTSFTTHPIFKGLKKIYLKEIASLELKAPAKAILSEKGETYMAESKIGKGTVIAVGDPWIYNEYIDHDLLPASFENRQAAENLTGYLLSCIRKK
ncbi:MAG: DUF4350 domain-containing protein [Bacteroidales bacterium]|nr:DUF4350 domain-containing protein [Bacteroidales bacterium]